MQPSNASPARNFGKRGRVDLAPEQSGAGTALPKRKGLWRWAVGGIAAIFMLALVTGASGGTGLLGGLIGGLLGHQLAKRMTGSTTAGVSTPRASPSAATTGTVSRGGFGSTGSSGGFFSGG